MKNSKKILAFLLAFVMVLAVACSPANNSGTTTTDKTSTNNSSTTEGGTTTTTEPKKPASLTEVTVAGSGNLANMDYLVTGKAPDHTWNANFVETLLEIDNVGRTVGSLAESWSVSEDGLTWTFKLRQGVKWVTNTQEEYADLVAEDFVTGLRHAAEYKSEANWLLEGIVKGFAEYTQSDFSDAAWEKVGVKAVDAQTVVYTLEKPAPYFVDIATYNILMPVNKEFLESKGAVLGKPDPENSTFGSVAPDSILYNGAFVLQSVDAKSSIVMVKNAKFWDAANVKIEKYTEIYDDGKDPYSIKTGFENGVYPSMSLRTSWADYAAVREQYATYIRESLPQSVVFGIIMNFNRQTFENTNYATDETLKARTQKALQNENFRKALRAAYDRVAANAVATPEHLALASLKNINNFNEAGIHSDGRGYNKLVTDTYNKNTGQNVDLGDGVAAFFSKDEALKYIEAAKAEGVEFPVHLDMLVIETSDSLVKQANSMKKSIADNTDGQIVIELVLRPQDTVEAIAFANEDPAAADFDLNTFAGWGPDYRDPQSFAKTFSTKVGTYMTSTGLGTVDADGNQLNAELKESLGFNQYEKLLEEAANEQDHDKRLEKFALVDSFLIEKALFIPNRSRIVSEMVSRMVPFKAAYSQVGISEYKVKYLEMQENLVTAEEYAKAKAEWEKAVKDAAAQQ